MTTTTNETTIANAIARSKSHNEIVRVKFNCVANGIDDDSIRGIIRDLGGDCSEENDGSLDCCGDDWRINVMTTV